jgi:sugar/nucleoside kinase (ribokinase family)
MSFKDTIHDVVAVGNALVDILAQVPDSFLAAHGMEKGTMSLIDAERALQIQESLGETVQTSGGSAANTMSGIASLGGSALFIGKVSNDSLGDEFAREISSIGVEFVRGASVEGMPTGRCLIAVTPDAQRTMNTFLGASQYLPATVIDKSLIESAAILYLEGYLWDPEEPRAAMRTAIDVARAAGRKVALTLSDAFVISRHGPDFLAEMEAGRIDILFSNEVEICALNNSDDFEASVAAIAAKVPLLVCTRGEQGAIAVENGVRTGVGAEPVAQLVDTTGAGDLFAAGVFAGLTQGRPMAECLTMGAICAAEIISHYGARPEADIADLVAKRLA